MILLNNLIKIISQQLQLQIILFSQHSNFWHCPFSQHLLLHLHLILQLTYLLLLILHLLPHSMSFLSSLSLLLKPSLLNHQLCLLRAHSHSGLHLQLLLQPINRLLWGWLHMLQLHQSLILQRQRAIELMQQLWNLNLKVFVLLSSLGNNLMKHLCLLTLLVKNRFERQQFFLFWVKSWGVVLPFLKKLGLTVFNDIVKLLFNLLELMIDLFLSLDNALISIVSDKSRVFSFHFLVLCEQGVVLSLNSRNIGVFVLKQPFQTVNSGGMNLV